MPYIVITGGKRIDVSDYVFDRILASKQGGADSKHLMDIGSAGFIEIGQIKQLMRDDQDVNGEAHDRAVSEERRKQHLAYQAETAAIMLKTSAEKAERVIDTYAQLLWTIRGNWQQVGDRIQSPLREALMERLTAYFDAHPEEWSCSRTVYEDLIPYGEAKAARSKVPGALSLGDALIPQTEVPFD